MLPSAEKLTCVAAQPAQQRMRLSFGRRVAQRSIVCAISKFGGSLRAVPSIPAHRFRAAACRCAPCRAAPHRAAAWPLPPGALAGRAGVALDRHEICGNAKRSYSESNLELAQTVGVGERVLPVSPAC